MRPSRQIALVVMTLVLGCAHTSKTPSVPSLGVVAGTVTDMHGVTRQYCNVTVMQAQLGAQTGADGRYSIPNVPVGTYTVRTAMPGFDRQDRDSVHVGEHDTTIVNFVLKERAQRIEHVDVVH